VRRLITISLLLFFLLPIVSPLFAAMPDEANLPACCRRNGKHHCMMTAATQSAANQAPRLQSVTMHEKCPCAFLLAQSPAHLNFTHDEAEVIYAGVVSHPACQAQTEARRRISFDRSRHKRGPPVDLL
jgi:hypothetical protein